MKNEQLSETQSLELIASMIRDSRTRLARNSGMPFLAVASRRHELSVNQAVEVDDKRHMGHLNTQMPWAMPVPSPPTELQESG